MDHGLQQAIEGDDVQRLYELIEQKGNLLNCELGDPFPNTPLHKAAHDGKTRVAMEIAILMPSYARKLNKGGYSPMHLALQEKHVHTARALMTLDPELIRVRGRGGITPLHIVVGEKEHDDKLNKELLELLAEFLVNCKSSIEDLTNQCETAIHVAVKSGNTEAFKVLFGWLKRVNLIEILNWKNQDGNTVLEIAQSQPRQSEIVSLLIGKPTVHAFAYHVGKLCLEVRGERPGTPKLSLSEFLSMELTAFEKFVSLIGLKDEYARSIILAVATLITTATYQAALTPPGGYWQDDSSSTPANSTVVTVNSTVVTVNSTGIAVEKPHEAGELILTGRKLYSFLFLNTMVFLASIITIWINAIPLLPRTLPVHLLIVLVASAYMAPLASGFPQTDVVIGTLLMAVYFTLLAIVMAGPLCLWIEYYRVQRRIDVKGRRVRNFLEL